MPSPRRLLVRALVVVACGSAGALLCTPLPASAAPASVSGLAASLGAHGLQLTWTDPGSGTPIVRDVTNESSPYSPSGPALTAAPTADCPLSTCLYDGTFPNTASRTYAVWATDDGTSATASADPATLSVGPLPAVATTTVLDPVPASVTYPGHLALSGSVTRAGLPLAGVQVRLLSGVGTAVPATSLATATTAADGRVSFALVPSRTRTYQLAFDGDAFSAASSSASGTVALVPVLTSSWASATVPWRQTAVLRGSVRPALPGTAVVVQRQTSAGWTTVARPVLSSAGTWSWGTAPALGRYRFRAVLPATAAWESAESVAPVLTVTPRVLAQGQVGPDVLSLERRLAALHYDVGRVDGVFDSDLRHAVVTFQKLQRLPRTGTWSSAERARVGHPQVFRPRFHDARLTAEVDVTRQVLALVRNGVVLRLVDVSTGSERAYVEEGVRQVAHTPRGVFSIYFKINGTQISPLGELYRPSYFFRGFAIHGNGSVPTYPASHGCVRIPMHVADRLFAVLAVGTRVAVYDE